MIGKIIKQIITKKLSPERRYIITTKVFGYFAWLFSIYRIAAIYSAKGQVYIISGGKKQPETTDDFLLEQWIDNMQHNLFNPKQNIKFPIGGKVDA